VEFLGKLLAEGRIPVIKPFVGLGCDIDAVKFLDHISREQYPAGTLTAALYLTGGIGCAEMGTLSQQRNADGLAFSPRFELVRLAIPKGVFTMSHLVQVREDQRQHLELPRDGAEKFNGIYGPPLCHISKPLIRRHCTRVMSFQNPMTKMSKLDPNSLATIFLSDSDNEMMKTIRSAVTDSVIASCTSDEKPGIPNLLRIFRGVSGKSITALERESSGTDDGKFKTAVAETVIKCVQPIHERMEALKKDYQSLQSVVENSRKEAQRPADAVLENVYRRVGFARPRCQTSSKKRSRGSKMTIANGMNRPKSVSLEIQFARRIDGDVSFVSIAYIVSVSASDSSNSVKSAWDAAYWHDA
jgi:hypothetical protein